MKAKKVITKRDDKGRVLEYKFLVDGKEVPKGYKFCSVCKTVKSTDEFTSKGGCCAECAKQKARDWYANAKANPEYRKKLTQQGKERARKSKDKIVDYFGNKCNDCGQKFPNCCYDVHHLDPAEKDFNLSAKRGFDDVLVEELKKCVLLCSNCHRIRHFKE